MAVVPVLDDPVRVLWNRDRQRLPWVDHRDRACPHALTSGGLIERRNGGVGCHLRRRPWSPGCRDAWRRSERPGRGGGGRDYRRISRRIAHSERVDICHRHDVSDGRQKDARRRCSGNVGRPRRHGEPRWCGAHVAHYLSAVSNQNSHKPTVADLFAALKSYPAEPLQQQNCRINPTCSALASRSSRSPDSRRGRPPPPHSWQAATSTSLYQQSGVSS